MRDTISDPVADARLASRCVLRAMGRSSRGAARPGRPTCCASSASACAAATDLAGSDRGGEGLGGGIRRLGGRAARNRDWLWICCLARWRDRSCVGAAPALALKHLADPRLRPALAYATAWLQVAGARSVLPPWVRHRFPETADLLRALRDIPCDDPACTWCAEVHNPRAQLKRWFGFDAFRPTPGRSRRTAASKRPWSHTAWAAALSSLSSPPAAASRCASSSPPWPATCAAGP